MSNQTQPISAAALRRRKVMSDDAFSEYLRAIYQDILVPVCDARDDHMELRSFQIAYLDLQYPATEYRFQGNLGFGGKCYIDGDGRARVGYYPEDKTAHRDFTMATANTMLAELFERFSAASASPRA